MWNVCGRCYLPLLLSISDEPVGPHRKSYPPLAAAAAPAPNAAKNDPELRTLLPPRIARMGVRGPPKPPAPPGGAAPLLLLAVCFAFHSATVLASSYVDPPTTNTMTSLGGLALYAAAHAICSSCQGLRGDGGGGREGAAAG